MDGRVKQLLRVGLAVTVVVAAVPQMSRVLAAQQKPVTAAEGWVQTPAAGATTAIAFALVRNPTMYDVYVTAASADVAGSVELRQAAPGTAGKAVPQITVPAYESVRMTPDGVHLLLKDLKAPLKEGATVNLTLTTDQGVFKVPAVVRKQ
jgi:copper(I)-binding protein